jgi:hypothetical protein
MSRLNKDNLIKNRILEGDFVREIGLTGMTMSHFILVIMPLSLTIFNHKQLVSPFLFMPFQMIPKTFMNLLGYLNGMMP